MLSPATVGVIIKAAKPAARVAGWVLVGFVIMLALTLAMINSILSTMSQSLQQGTGCLSAGTAIAGNQPHLVSTEGAALRVRVGSWNTLARNRTQQVVAGITELGRRADVIGLQELSPQSRRDEVARALGDTFGISQGNNAVQILWNKARYTLLAQGSEEVFGVRRIEGGVSGTSIGPKSIQWVQLRDTVTGAVFFVANHHIVPTIDRRGRPDTRNPVRLALYRQQMSALVALIARLRPHGPVVVTGDFNVAAWADARERHPSFPYAVLRRAGLASNWSQLGFGVGPTHGRRHIDYVWTTTDTARATAQTVLSKSGSDHSPLVVAVGGGPARGSTPVTAAAVPSVPGLSPEQARVAAGLYAAGVGVGRELGWSGAKTQHATVILLATAMQESTMGANPRSRRPDGNGDAGVLAQRTLPGWYGTADQVNDPALAGRWFLLGKDVTAAEVAAARRNGTRPAGAAGYHIPGLNQVAGFEDLPVTTAAQRVQRSAFPDAYARWEPLARRAVEALQVAGVVDGGTLAPAGCSDDALAAEATGTCDPTGLPAEQGLTPDALLVLRCTAGRFPEITTYYGATSKALDHGTGKAVDIMTSSAFADYRGAAGMAYGWEIARWARANAQALGVHYVIFAARIWNIERDAEGWRPYASITGSNNDSSLHYNHVHVSVWGNQGTGLGDPAPVVTGGWTLPLAAAQVGCGFGGSRGCPSYRTHTGQDFPAAVGTPVRSTNDGVVVQSRALRGRTGYYSYGIYVQIRDRTDPGLTVWYAHLSRRDVEVGEVVRAGQVIGASGNTGNSKGPHLHYEIRDDGTPVDPMAILARRGVNP